MANKTNLHIETENGKFYVYDVFSNGSSCCLGVFTNEKDAKAELRRLLKIEKEAA